MSHLENLIAEYYEWMGYLVRCNVKVGRLTRGGWEMELDVVAYNPHTEHLIHLEPSLDAQSWATREERFKKKFGAGRKYIFSEVFTWLPETTAIDQIAVLISHPKGRDSLAGAKLMSIDELMAQIRADVRARGIAGRNAIAEQYPLLRTIQLTVSGYYKIIPETPIETFGL